MAESVKEVVPETRPRGQRRGLDRLRASGGGQAGQNGQVGEGMPTGTTVREAAPTAIPKAPASEAVRAPSEEALVERPATAEAAEVATVPAEAQATSSSSETALPASEPGKTTPTMARGKRFRVLVAVIALLALLVAFLGYRLWHTHSSAQADKRQYEQLNAEDARNQAVLSAARQAAVTLLTYDYRHLDQDFAAVINGSTGGFKKDFASRQSTAKALFTQGKAIASGQVLDAAVSSSTANSATVLVVIDQSVKNVSVPNGTTKHYRMQLKLNKVGSSWLVSDVEFPA